MNKNKSKISLVVMTANSWRHRYFANRLLDHFNLLGVVSEVKRPLRAGETSEENQIIKTHSREREEEEKKFFREETRFNLPVARVMKIEYGQVNDQEVFEWVSGLGPRYIALFGTGIIKDPLLGTFENRIINMHLGLSPYYRGSGTNFWPLVFAEPELVGVTVHLAIEKVDAGSILGQARPQIEIGDAFHEIGFKAIEAGVEIFARCVEGYDTGKIKPQTQRLDIGKVFKHKDFTAQAVLKMKENFKKGMVKEYLAHKNERDTRYPIIELKNE